MIGNYHPAIVTFGTFQLDLRSGELRKSGVKIPLQEQPFRLLVALLERPGELVKREELRLQLWSTDTFVGFEHSLNAAVRRLRLALGDNTQTPRFVETFHRRGYRFVAPVGNGYGRAEAQDARGYRAVRNGTRTKVAVLPFSKIAAQTHQDRFSEGLTEETIAQLARSCTPAIGIIAPSSVKRAQEAGKSAAEIGRALGVEYLLEGSVRTAQGRVRITTQLIDAADETHLWAEVYDRDTADCFAVQQEVATLIAQNVARRLLTS